MRAATWSLMQSREMLLSIGLSIGLALALVVSLAASYAAVPRHPGHPSAYDPLAARVYDHYALDAKARYAAYDARPDPLGRSGGGAFA